MDQARLERRVIKKGRTSDRATRLLRSTEELQEVGIAAGLLDDLADGDRSVSAHSRQAGCQGIPGILALQVSTTTWRNIRSAYVRARFQVHAGRDRAPPEDLRVDSAPRAGAPGGGRRRADGFVVEEEAPHFVPVEGVVKGRKRRSDRVSSLVGPDS